jgi:hypothetical protein
MRQALAQIAIDRARFRAALDDHLVELQRIHKITLALVGITLAPTRQQRENL